MSVVISTSISFRAVGTACDIAFIYRTYGTGKSCFYCFSTDILYLKAQVKQLVVVITTFVDFNSYNISSHDIKSFRGIGNLQKLFTRRT